MSENLTEEQQVEAIKSWWKENGMSVVLGLLIGFGGLFGWNYWKDYRDDRAAAASLIYQDMLLGLQANKTDVVKTHAQTLVDKYSATPYASLAAFSLARVAVEASDMPTAKTQLQWVLDNTSNDQFEHTARLRLARVMISSNDIDSASALITNVKVDAYAAAYAELQGDIAVAKGDKSAARAAYQSALEASADDNTQRSAIQQKLDDVAVVSEAG